MEEKEIVNVKITKEIEKFRFLRVFVFTRLNECTWTCGERESERKKNAAAIKTTKGGKESTPSKDKMFPHTGT